MVPELVTVADFPYSRVVTVPTFTVGLIPSVPSFPSVPAGPGSPVDPVAPVGIPKSKIASVSVPALVTVAADPGLSVVTVPTFTVAASPESPWIRSEERRVGKEC